MSDEMFVPARLRRGTAVRYLLGVTAGIVVLLLLFGKRNEFVKALRELAHLNAAWEIVAVLVWIVSLWAFAYLQYHVLRAGESRLALPSLFLISIANNAIANTIPGEPAVSCAYRFTFYRRRGASSASAAWSILTILIAQAIGMSLILLVGVVVSLFGTSKSPSTALVVAGLVVVLGAGALLLRQDLLLRFVEMMIRMMQRMTGHPRGDVARRIESTLQRMREIPLQPEAMLRIVLIATSVWLLDFLCLLCSFKAVHAPVPWTGVLLAYGVAQIVATLPLVPGGFGLVEGSLAVILVAYGTPKVPALAVVLAYRLLTFWTAIIVGWGSVGVIEWRSQRRGNRTSNTKLGYSTIDRDVV